MTKAKLLVVEDSDFMQEIINQILIKLGHQAEFASGGAEAIDMISENDYSLIFLDCQIPILDGYEVAREIRDREAKGYILKRNIIIACTANNMEGDREKSIDSGMDDHIIKPVTQDLIEATLEIWMPEYSIADR